MILRRILFILLLHSTMLPGVIAQESSTPYFLRLTSFHGLPVQAVYDIKFDHLGYAWIASREGLYKYDGHHFRKIKYFEGQDSVGYNPHVKRIEIGKNGKIWVASLFNGVFEYDYKTGAFKKVISAHKAKLRDINRGKESLLAIYTNGTFVKYDLKTESTIVLPLGVTVYRVLPGNSGGAWVATAQGLWHIQRDFLLKNVKKHIPHMSIVAMESDPSGFIWLSQGKSFSKFFPENRHLQHFELKNDRHQPALKVLKLFVDKNNLWLANEGNGLVKVDKISGEVTRIKHDPLNQNSISSNTVLAVQEDKFGNTWIGNNQGGVNVLLNQSRGLTYYKGGKGGPSKKVLSLYIGPAGDEWVGTDGDGLIVHRPDKYSHWNLNEKTPQVGNYIQSLLKIREDALLIASYDFGLSIYEEGKDRPEKIPFLNYNGEPIHIGPDVRTMHKDTYGRVWLSSEQGLFVTDSVLNVLKHFDYKSDLPCEIVSCLEEDGKQTIYVGTIKGEIYAINLDDLSLKPISGQLEFGKHKGFPKFDVSKLKVDPSGSIWVGTRNHGLFVISPNLNTIRRFEHKNFNEISIYSIELDDQGNTWVSASKGLYYHNVSTGSVTNVSGHTGFYNHYLKKSSFKDHKGDLYFGGTNGLVKITPGKVDINNVLVPAILPTDFFISNVRVSPSKEGPLFTGIEHTRSIELNHNQSSFSVGFTVIGQLIGSKYDLSYKMSPLEEEWQQAGDDRVAKYTNLSAGHYTLEIRLDNPEPHNVEPLQMEIIITPPWWKTSWAYILFFIVTVALLALFYKYIYEWARLKHSLQLEKMLREKEKSLNKMKIDFFTKISHEIRTPLTLIMGPLLKLKETCQYDYKASNYINIVQFNAERLTHLAEQVLDLGKNETGTLTLRLTNKPVFELFKEVSASYGEVARQEQVAFHPHFPAQLPDFWCDYEKLEQILFNLLSNAFKYSAEKGKVILRVTANQAASDKFPAGYLSIVVLDRGKGIDENDLEHIFDMFYRSSDEKMEGYGIGLALVNELVKLHGGEIDVASKLGKGTRFRVKLPLGKHHPQGSQQVYIDLSPEQSPAIIKSTRQKSTKDTVRFEHTLLIVEDNLQIQHFMQDIFAEEYNLIAAYDGVQGLQMTKKHMPDLVLSDVAMPEMDGYEMTYHLKNHAKTAHIPIILLTARTAYQHKIEGLENGANDYVTKPFDPKTLRLKVENLLRTKEKAEQFIRQEILATPKPVEALNANELFLKELVAIIEEKLQDTDLKINEIAKAMGMSHIVLYRKCVSITGHTVVDLVKITRLKKALKLIEAGQCNVSSAAYEVGFNDVKYFRKCFKAYFGKAPSAFLAKGPGVPKTGSNPLRQN